MSTQVHFAHTGGISGGFGLNILTGTYTGSSQQRATPIPPGGAGTFRNWSMRVATAPGTGQSITFTIQKNNFNTGLTITIAGANTTGTSTGVDVHFADGDTIDASWSKVGAAAVGEIYTALDYEPDVENTLLFAFDPEDLSASNPHVAPFSGGGAFSASDVFNAENLVGVDGTITGMAVLTRTLPSAGNSFEYAVYKNGVKQDGSGGTVDARCTITDSTPGNVDTSTFSLPVVVGDYLRITFATTGGSGSTYDVGSIAFMPDDPTDAMIAMTGVGASTSATEYNHPRAARVSWGPTESDVAYHGGISPMTLTGMIVRLSGAPGVGNSWTFRLRNNGANTTIVVTVADAATTGAIGGQSVTIANGDLWSLSSTPSGTPDAGSTEVEITLPGAGVTESTLSKRNLLTGTAHTVTGRDDVIAGDSGTVVGDRVAMFNMKDGVPDTFTGDNAFIVNADVIEFNGSGVTTGPASSTDEALARYNGTSGALQNSAIVLSDTGALTFPDNVRQTFNPGADAAGINVGSIAGDPGTPSNGDLWYDSMANEFTARINGANVALGAAGGAPADAQYVALATNGTLTNERVLTAGSGITLTDAGAGSTITVAVSGSPGGGPVFARKTSDESVTSSITLQNDDALLLAIGANEIWLVDLTLFYDAATTGDIRIAFNAPSGATGTFGINALANVVANTQGDAGGFAAADLTDSGAVQMGGAGAGQIVLALVRVLIINSTNAGNLQLRWAQGSSSGTATIVKADSVMMGFRIA